MPGWVCRTVASVRSEVMASPCLRGRGTRSAWVLCGWSGYRSAWLETLLRVRDGGFKRPCVTPRSEGRWPLSPPNWAPIRTSTTRASRPYSSALSRPTWVAEKNAGMGRGAGSALAAQQASQHPPHDLPPDPTGHAARWRLGHGLHQPIVLATAWAGAAEQGFVDHATEAATLRFGFFFGRAGNARCLHAASIHGRGLGCARVHMGTQDLVGTFAVHRFFVHPRDQRVTQQLLALCVGDRAKLAAGRHYIHALGLARAAFGVEQAHERLAHRS